MWKPYFASYSVAIYNTLYQLSVNLLVYHKSRRSNRSNKWEYSRIKLSPSGALTGYQGYNQY